MPHPLRPHLTCAVAIVGATTLMATAVSAAASSAPIPNLSCCSVATAPMPLGDNMFDSLPPLDNAEVLRALVADIRRSGIVTALAQALDERRPEVVVPPHTDTDSVASPMVAPRLADAAGVDRQVVTGAVADMSPPGTASIDRVISLLGQAVQNTVTFLANVPGQLLAVAETAVQDPSKIPGLLSYLAYITVNTNENPVPGIPTSLVAGFLGPVFTALVEALPSPIGGPDGLVFNGATAVGNVIVSLLHLLPLPVPPTQTTLASTTKAAAIQTAPTDTDDNLRRAVLAADPKSPSGQLTEQDSATASASAAATPLVAHDLDVDSAPTTTSARGDAADPGTPPVGTPVHVTLTTTDSQGTDTTETDGSATVGKPATVPATDSATHRGAMTSVAAKNSSATDTDTAGKADTAKASTPKSDDTKPSS